MASEREKEIAREKFAVVVTFLVLVPLLLMGFFFIVLGLKLQVLDREAVILIDAGMTFGYVILWFIVKGYLLKYFKPSKIGARPSKKAAAKPGNPAPQKEGRLAKLFKGLLKRKDKEEEAKKRKRWRA